MKNKFLRVMALACVLLLLTSVFVACGNSSASTSAGTYGDSITWSYDADTETLTVTGKGAIPNATVNEGEDIANAPKNIPWAAVRSSATRLVVGDGITAIGSYAFHGMSALKSAELSASVASIGDCAFTFCSSLDNINIPDAVTSIGKSAFEGCTSLESIKIPQATTTIGERAFAFCRDLDTVIIASVPSQIGRWTFKDCINLNTLLIAKDTNVAEGATPVVTTYHEEAFVGAKISTPGEYSNEVLITVICKDITPGDDPIEPQYYTKKTGDTYEYKAPEISGFTVQGESVKVGVVGTEDIELYFNYIKAAETTATETQAPAESDTAAAPAEEKSPTESIILIVVLIVLIIGICVGAVLLVRSNKKAKANGTTVRKNNDNDKSKKKK